MSLHDVNFFLGALTIICCTITFDALTLLMHFLAGTAYGSLENPKLTFSQGVNLRAGINKISLLSIAVGLQVRPVLFLL